MTLDDYLNSEGSLSVADLAAAIRCAPAQIRQWKATAKGDRLPGAAYCSAIEQATERRVCRWDLRPDDWHRIWPELIGLVDAPALPVAEQGA